MNLQERIEAAARALSRHVCQDSKAEEACWKTDEVRNNLMVAAAAALEAAGLPELIESCGEKK